MNGHTSQTITIVNETHPAEMDLQVVIFQKNLAAPDAPPIPWKVVQSAPGADAAVIAVPRYYVVYAEIAGSKGVYQSNRIILDDTTAALRLHNLAATEIREEALLLDIISYGEESPEREPIRVEIESSVRQEVVVHVMKDNHDVLPPIHVMTGQMALFQPQSRFYMVLVGKDAHTGEILHIGSIAEVHPEQKVTIVGNRESGLELTVVDYEYDGA